jgi:hypothetical protein
MKPNVVGWDTWNVGFTTMGIRKLKSLLFIIIDGELDIEGT